MKNYNLEDLKSDNPNIKYGMQKKILKLSEEKPADLYVDFDYFVELLDNSNNILRWTGILVLGNLASVDKDKKLGQVLPKLISMLDTGKMITAANTIKSLTEIAKAKPELADELVQEILKVKKYKYDSEECSNIAVGHALKNIESILNLLTEDTKNQVMEFAQAEISNTRPATAKKAQKLLSKC